MELKRVSFPVAKALREAGYPQSHGMCYYIGVDEFRPMEISRQAYNYNEHISAPYVIAVWLWLWREKNIWIEALNISNQFLSFINNKPFSELVYTDPEEAIIAAIKHLIKNDLIK